MVSGMLPDHGEQIYDVIRTFGDRQKLFDVYFRNIRGNFPNFRETFPDNGSVNWLRAMRTHKEVCYEYMVVPGHAPIIKGDSGHKQAFSSEYGNIVTALQTVLGASVCFAASALCRF